MLLTVESVSKQYSGGVWGLREVSFELGPGVHGLLGPNGAGKTTLMRILATLAQPTGGHVSWKGTDIRHDPDAVRRVLGYLPQDFGVYPHLTAREFLGYIAAAKGVTGRAARERIETLLALVNLTEAAGRALGGYSGGMRQRVGIAQALLADPQLLVVDEPTVGLDPEERARFRTLLAELAAERVVLLSTHIVSDVEAVAESILVLAGGRLLARTTPEAWRAGLDGRVWECVWPAAEFERRRAAVAVTHVARRGGDVVARIVADEAPDAGARGVAPTLEDAYLTTVGGVSA